MSKSSCLQFWYHMNGSDIGALNVIRKTKHGEKVIWSMNGQQGDQWHLGQVELTVQKGPSTSLMNTNPVKVDL